MTLLATVITVHEITTTILPQVILIAPIVVICLVGASCLIIFRLVAIPFLLWLTPSKALVLFTVPIRRLVVEILLLLFAYLAIRS